METVTTTPRDDLAALKAKRAHLRAWADDIAAAVEALDPPETFLDAERAARFVTMADRVILAIPSPDETAPANDLDLSETSVIVPARQRLRVYADKLLDLTTALPMPKTFLEGERAGRCVLATDRMLVQLYTPPKAPKYDPLHDAVEDEEMDDSPEAQERLVDSLIKKIDDRTRDYAAECGFWPNGQAYVAGETVDDEAYEIRKDLLPDGCFYACSSGDPEDDQPDPVTQVLFTRFLACACACVVATGVWPDGQPWVPGAPQPFFISENYRLTKEGRYPVDGCPAGNERPAAKALPWWLVRRSDPPDTG